MFNYKCTVLFVKTYIAIHKKDSFHFLTNEWLLEEKTDN